jgi:hypothetical protein
MKKTKQRATADPSLRFGMTVFLFEVWPGERKRRGISRGAFVVAHRWTR